MTPAMRRPIALLIGICMIVVANAAAAGGAKVQTRALTLEEMTEKAELIVQGMVTRTVHEDQLIEGLGDTAVEVFEYSLKLSKVLKGNARPGQTIKIRQLARLAVDVKRGEELILYLPTESRFGLRAPLGLYSGHFKVIPSRGSGRTFGGGSAGKSVINLRNNKGLFRRPASESTSERRLPSDPGTLSASRPRVPATGPLPLELLEERTKALTR